MTGGALTAVAALGCGAVGGVFFTFSTFTLQGLTRLPAAQGVAAMQSINLTAVRPALMTALFGTGAACAALTLWSGDRSPLVVAGSALYLVGSLGVTVVANVPLNNALAALDPGSSDADGAWRHYVRRWSRWNHVRTLSCLTASAAFLTALAQT